MSGGITLVGIISVIGTAIGILVYLYVATQIATVVIENPEPFIDAGETVIESVPKIIEAVNVMCNIDELFINVIDNPMLRNVSDNAQEVLFLLKNGTEIDVCQAQILEEGLTAMQKNRINFKKLSCNIAECLN